jgi:hypothetical protein
VQINTTILSLDPYSPSTLTIPTQTDIVAYYSVTFQTAGDSISTINITLPPTGFPAGYQAIIFVDGSAGTTVTPCIISSGITSGSVRTNISSNVQLIGTGSNLQYATITITTDGSLYYCNIVGYY